MTGHKLVWLEKGRIITRNADGGTTPNLNTLRCHDCGASFVTLGWRLRCPECVAACVEAMRKASWEEPAP